MKNKYHIEPRKIHPSMLLQIQARKVK